MTPRDWAGFAQERKSMCSDPVSEVEFARTAQQAWATTPVAYRLRILRKFRHALAESAEDLAASVPCERPGSLHRTIADTLVCEVLPLAEACRFLEREASAILSPKKQGTRNRPFWLRGVATEIYREPLGVVLLIAPSNYPLFLPGVQALQALAAGNAVLWKPAPGGTAVARALRLMLVAAGADPLLLQIQDESPATATATIHAGVDKVFLTGSETTGRVVLHDLAETITPSVMELSGCDAVFVLESADLNRVVAALTFGMRLNGSATCMAPRRIFATGTVANKLAGHLATALDQLDPVQVPESTSNLLQELMFDAESSGAKFFLNGFDAATHTEGGGTLLYPTLVVRATPDMRIAQTDVFAPVLSIIEVANWEEALAANRRCPYALTAAIFGERSQAQRLASRIHAGSVLINDVIVSTADPRAPFTGRKRSGFGSTRGREGLLEMTAIKTVQTQSATDLRAYTPHTPHHESFFAGYLRMVHSGSWKARFDGMREFFKAMTKIK
jgi:acyl-CoA reductase-like NAD-dependent aldehyde dehydrogenase